MPDLGFCGTPGSPGHAGTIRRQLTSNPFSNGHSTYRQAVLVLRCFLDGTRLVQLAADNACPGPVLPPFVDDPERELDH